MKKLFVCLLATQLCAINGIHKDDSNIRVVLPEAPVVKREIGRFIFEDFFTKTLVLDHLAKQKKSKDEIVEVLTSCANLYFKRTDQPAGRDFFVQRIDTIAQTLVALNTPFKPQHTCKLHAQSATHENLNRSPNSKL